MGNSKTETETGSSTLETALQPSGSRTGGAKFRKLEGPFEHDLERLGRLLTAEAWVRP